MPNTKLTVQLPALALALFAACTTSSSSSSSAPRQDASHAFSVASTRLEAAASALGTHVAPVTGAINITSPCSLGGDLGLTGTFDSDTGTRFDVDATFTACAEADGSLDGTLHWKETVAASITDAWSGTLDFTDTDGSWQCVFDYQSIIDGASVHYSGTICGYDVNTDLDLSN